MSETARESRMGSRFGPYVLRRQLRCGGMSEPLRQAMFDVLNVCN